MSEHVAIILAAGAGNRLGGVAKALLPIGEATFLQRIWATARSAGVQHGIVVTAPPFADSIAVHASSMGLAVVRHQQPERGMGFSVAAGFQEALQLPSVVDFAWLWPVDHPRVSSATLRALSQFDSVRYDGAVPSCDARGGHPLLLHRRAWRAMTRAEDASDGARTILRTLRIDRIVVDDVGVLRDVDHPQDLPL